MQAVNYVAPLAIIPYVTRIFDPNEYGLYVTLLALVQVCYVVTDWGFSLSATYYISINREIPLLIEDKIKIIGRAKMLLLLICAPFILSLPLVLGAGHLSLYDLLIIYWIVTVQAFVPVWLFRGLERMNLIALYNVLAKMLYMALVFLFVRHAGQLTILLSCFAAAESVALFLALELMRKVGYCYEFKLARFELKKSIGELKQTASFFWSRAAASLYSSVGLLILGVVNPAQAAYYSISETVYKAGVSVTSPVNNALYPYMAKNADWTLFFRLIFPVGLLIALFASILSIYSDLLVDFFFGPAYSDAALILSIFILMSAVSYLSISFGYSVFAALSRLDLANISVIVGAVVYAVSLLALYLASSINALNMVVVYLVSELTILVFRIYWFQKLRRFTRKKTQDI